MCAISPFQKSGHGTNFRIWKGKDACTALLRIGKDACPPRVSGPASALPCPGMPACTVLGASARAHHPPPRPAPRRAAHPTHLSFLQLRRRARARNKTHPRRRRYAPRTLAPWPARAGSTSAARTIPTPSRSLNVSVSGAWARPWMPRSRRVHSYGLLPPPSLPLKAASRMNFVRPERLRVTSGESLAVCANANTNTNTSPASRSIGHQSISCPSCCAFWVPSGSSSAPFRSGMMPHDVLRHDTRVVTTPRFPCRRRGSSAVGRPCCT